MSQTKDKATQTAVETLVSGGVKELIVREGKAQEVFSPRVIAITGILDSPLKWLQKRVATIEQLAANIIIDRDKMSITYTEKELDHFANVITGVLELHPVFNRFKINAGVYQTPEKLAEFFKMHRSFFENHSIAMNLVSDLKNFKAKVNQEIEKSNDNRGNTKGSKVQAVESNLPEKFNLVIPIFKGQPKFTIEVEVYINPDDLTCTLISPAVNDKIEELRDSSIDEVINQIIAIAPNIVIIEK